MKQRRTPNKDALHLRRKMELYESFLFRYLPQLASLSYITRINVYDCFGSAGLDKTATLGTPFLIFQALQKQREHHLKKKLPLKPFSFRLLPPPQQTTFAKAFDLLVQKNTGSNTCKLESWPLTFPENVKRLARQVQQQPASEKNLLLLDPLGIPRFSLQEILYLAEKKIEILIYLPLAALWQLHFKPEKGNPSAELCALKETLDGLFPAEHSYWSPEATPREFAAHIKEAFRMNGSFYSAPDPGETTGSEGALLALSADAFIFEKVLLALQAMQTTHTPPPGEQLPLFGSQETREEELPDTDRILSLISEETDNQRLYSEGLQAGFLPLPLYRGLAHLTENGKIEVLDDKGKQLSSLPPNCISHTAFKAARAACSFRLKE